MPNLDRSSGPALASGRNKVRVRYAETDRMDVVYHAHYFVWFETGRVELMRELGCDYRTLEDRDGILFPLIDAGARYLKSARFDDVLEVCTELMSVGRARVRFEYRVRREGDGTLLTTGFTEHAAVDRDGRPRRLPEEIRRRLRGEGSRS